MKVLVLLFASLFSITALAVPPDHAKGGGKPDKVKQLSCIADPDCLVQYGPSGVEM